MTDIFDAAKNASTVIDLTDWLQIRAEEGQSEPDAGVELFLGARCGAERSSW